MPSAKQNQIKNTKQKQKSKIPQSILCGVLQQGTTTLYTLSEMNQSPVWNGSSRRNIVTYNTMSKTEGNHMYLPLP